MFMKIKGVVIKDEETGKFTAFIRQFPGICAQADSTKEAEVKLQAYYKAFIERMRNQEVDIEDEEIVSM